MTQAQGQSNHFIEKFQMIVMSNYEDNSLIKIKLLPFWYIFGIFSQLKRGSFMLTV
jgi:hypothetical protein